MDKLIELIEKIKAHQLGNKKEAFSLYNSLCAVLKEKYGPVDKDYDDNPTKRGKEWLDIHHTMEYELDDIAQQTNHAIKTAKEIASNSAEKVTVTVSYEDFFNESIMEEIRKAHPNVWLHITVLEYTLEDLKPYNVKEKLVYANKIEHFLLHYLISSFHGKKMFSGGPNYLWDECIALDYYGFDKEYMVNIQNKKEKYYSLMSSEEITLLYKKLIGWKNWDVKKCHLYWNTIKYMERYLNDKKVSYVKDKDKFFKLLDIINYKFDEETKNKIISLPFKYRITTWGETTVKVINEHLYSLDEKTLVLLDGPPFWKKSVAVTVPSNVEHIAKDAFRFCTNVERITIPTTVKKIDDTTFIQNFIGARKRICDAIKTIVYRGSRTMWDENFSNVALDGITLVCKK